MASSWFAEVGLHGEVAHRGAWPFSLTSMLAVIVVRDGQLPAGADETISECGGRVVAGRVRHRRRRCWRCSTSPESSTIEVGDFKPAAWAAALAPHLADEPIVVMPASPDGRDFAPRLAAQLQRPLFAMSIAASSPSRIDLVRHAGTELHSFEPPRSIRGDSAARRPRCRPRRGGDDHARHRRRVAERQRPDDRTAAATRRDHDRPLRGGSNRRGWRRSRRPSPIRSTRRARRRHTRQRRAHDACDHRSRLGRPRATDRNHRRRSSTRSCTSRSASAGPCSTPQGSVDPITSSASTPTRTVR